MENNKFNCALEIVSDTRSIKGVRARSMETDEKPKEFSFLTPDFLIPESGIKSLGELGAKPQYQYEELKKYSCVERIQEMMIDCIIKDISLQLREHELDVYRKMISNEQNYSETIGNLRKKINLMSSNRTELKVLRIPAFTWNGTHEFIFLREKPYYKAMEIKY